MPGVSIGNWYQNQVATGANPSTPFSDSDIVTVVQKATAALGHAPKILMSSWSPPGYLKSTASTKGGGTLASAAGAFQYADFAQWWVNALTQYGSRGVQPDFITIQNEPDLSTNYESCLLDATEGSNAGFPQALDAVHAAIAASSLSPKPQILAPDPVGIGFNTIQRYLAGVDLGNVGGIGHHLYHGGDSGNDPAPDSFIASMAGVAATAAGAGKPTFMTEFQPNVPSIINTAWMIHNAVVVEGVTAYIYWPLFWAAPNTGPPIPPVTIETPTATFTTPKGYTLNDIYYVLKHFARWVDSGWIRVEITSSATAVKASAFISPDGNSLTTILINTDTTPHAIRVASTAFATASAAAYRTSGATERTTPVPVGAGTVVTMPARSIATVAFTR